MTGTVNPDTGDVSFFLWWSVGGCWWMGIQFIEKRELKCVLFLSLPPSPKMLFVTSTSEVTSHTSENTCSNFFPLEEKSFRSFDFIVVIFFMPEVLT